MRARLRRLLTSLILGVVWPGLAMAQTPPPQGAEGNPPAEQAPTAAKPANASVGRYPLPESGDIVGRVQTVEAKAEDTLIDIGQRYGIGYEAMRLANPDVNVWVPGEGTQVVVPTRFILPPGPREGIVINLAEMRLYYYPPARNGESPRVETYPIGIGRAGWQTPLGTTRIETKIKDPAWYPPKSIAREHAEDGRPLPSVVPAGPDNPLGEYAMILGLPGYMIHGTNRPQGVGMRVSHGCIRMLPRDIENLVHRIPDGTPVRIIDQPFKLGWDGAGTLFAQAYPVEHGGDSSVGTPPSEDVLAAVDQALKDHRFLVDFTRLEALRADPTGVPGSLLLAGRPFPLPEPPQTFFTRAQLLTSLYSQVAGDTAKPEKATDTPTP
ncbi:MULTISPECIES: L,D-transpeptidase family protein [unclassified Modicisalibacter]|uniref:L,D-transpeptidase family protein n=1 Tax=unclassified Modicisalibacter TaxID=2679913 RepID=UPI001CC9CEF7|nr:MULTISPECIES: L,D-transpeptidase family protein [unclassified Modicisalibacter]